MKKYTISKKNRLNRIPDEGDIVDLKINGVAHIFWGNDFAAQIYMFWGKICKI